MLFPISKIWKYIVQNDIKESWIIEDDAQIKNIDMFYLQLQQAKYYIGRHKQEKLFLSMSSKPISIQDSFYPSYEQKIINDNENINSSFSMIQGPIIGLHFYYVNNKMCRYLLKHLSFITYQIDLEIGLFAMRNLHNSSMFLYANDVNISQNKHFQTNIQFDLIDLQKLKHALENILGFNLIKLVYAYIPYVYKVSRDENKFNINTIRYEYK